MSEPCIEPEFSPNALIGDLHFVVADCCRHRWQLTDNGWRYQGHVREEGHRCEPRPHDFTNLPYKNMDPKDELIFHSKGEEYGDCCGYFKTTGIDLGGGGAFLFFRDATPMGPSIVGLKVWEPLTTPTELHLIEVTASMLVRLHLYASGTQEVLTPIVTLSDSQGTHLGTVTLDPIQGQYQYEGHAEIMVVEDTVIIAESNTGLRDELIIHVAPAAPRILDFEFGPYPGTQTELKEDDQITVRVTVDNTAETVTILDQDAAKEVSLTPGTPDEAGPGLTYFTGLITVSEESGLLPAWATAIDVLGSSVTGSSDDNLNLNQTYPTIQLIEIIYPVGQEAIKTGESASVQVVVNDFDTVTYMSPNVTIPNFMGYDETKLVDYLTGLYEIDPNYFVEANRVANDATTAAEYVVKIANVAALAAVTIDDVPNAILQSDHDGETYVVRVTMNQEMLSFASMDASGGLWEGVWVQVSPYEWVRELTAYNTDSRGPHFFTNLDSVNLSGIPSTFIASGEEYRISGFKKIKVFFPPFSQSAVLPAAITDVSKVRVKYDEAVNYLDYRPDTNEAFDQFSVVDSNDSPHPQGTHLWLSDFDISQSNTTGYLNVLIEEDI